MNPFAPPTLGIQPDPTLTGLIALFKFHRNRDRSNPNLIITRTAGKIGVVHRGIWAETPPDQRPKPDEFWACVVLNDYTKAGAVTNGCLILRPLEQVDKPKWLIPGLYNLVLPQEFLSGVVLAVPRVPGTWMLPVTTRKQIQTSHSATIVLTLLGAS